MLLFLLTYCRSARTGKCCLWERERHQQEGRQMGSRSDTDAAQGEDNSEIKEPLEDEEIEKEESEASSSEEEEPLPACNSPTQAQPSPTIESGKSQEEVLPSSPAPSPGRALSPSGQPSSSAAEVVL
ncbi:hypothetical protein H8959_022133 [Pygathrix nigripes]